jgi:hypothetical protein
MNHLTSLLEQLNDAESAYKRADSTLDSKPIEIIIAKEELKQKRFAFNKLSAKLAKELINNPLWLKECSRYIAREQY